MSALPASSELDALVSAATAAFAQAPSPADLENAKAQFLGKAGRVTALMKELAQLPPEEKKTRGAAINQAKQAIEAALTARRQALQEAELQQHLQAEALDVTLPGRQPTLSQLALGAHLAVQGLPGHGRDGRCCPMKYQAGILHGYFQNIAADFRPESLSAYLENPAKICLCPKNLQSIQKKSRPVSTLLLYLFFPIGNLDLLSLDRKSVV